CLSRMNSQILSPTLDRSQHLHSYDPAERPDKRPVKSETSSAVRIQTSDPCFRRQTRIRTVRTKREIPNRFRISRRVEFLETLGVDLFQITTDRPESSNNAEDQLAIQSFAKDLKPRSFQARKCHLLGRQSPQAKQPADDERLSKINLV